MEPPVGQFLVVFLNAVVNVLAQDGAFVGIGVGGHNLKILRLLLL